jgi:hypothetical protein
MGSYFGKKTSGGYLASKKINGYFGGRKLFGVTNVANKYGLKLLKSVGPFNTNNNDAQWDYFMTPYPGGDIIAANWNYVARIGPDLKRKWTASLLENPYFVGNPNGLIYVQTHDSVFGLDANTGSRKWRYAVPTGSGSAGAVLDPTTGYWMLLNKNTNTVMCLNTAGRLVWTSKALTGGVDSIKYFGINGGKLYAVTPTNWYQISIADGSITSNTAFTMDYFSRAAESYNAEVAYSATGAAINMASLQLIWKKTIVGLTRCTYGGGLAIEPTRGIGAASLDVSGKQYLYFVDLANGSSSTHPAIETDLNYVSAGTFSGDYLYVSGSISGSGYVLKIYQLTNL